MYFSNTRYEDINTIGARLSELQTLLYRICEDTDNMASNPTTIAYYADETRKNMATLNLIASELGRIEAVLETVDEIRAKNHMRLEDIL